MDRLTYIEKCNCESNKFCRFVNDLEQFSTNEKTYLSKQIVVGEFPKILYVSGVLAVWSLVAGIFDAILFPGIIVYAIFHGVIDYKVLTPPILFLVGNLIIKLIYIYSSLRESVKILDVLIAALPYAGSAYLLKKFIINDKLLSRAVTLYMKFKKQQFKHQVLSMIKIKS